MSSFVQKMWDMENCSKNMNFLIAAKDKNEMPVEFIGELISAEYPYLSKNLFVAFKDSDLEPAFRNARNMEVLVDNVADYLQKNVTTKKLTRLESQFKSYELLCQVSNDYHSAVRSEEMQKERERKKQSKAGKGFPKRPFQSLRRSGF